MKPEAKTFLLTGSSGFIGSRLKERLESEGHIVHSIPHGFLSMRGLLEDFAFQTHLKPDYIIHLAAYGNHYDQKDEYQTYESNITGLINLLDATVSVPYEGFINVSSSSVYGAKQSAMKETDSLDTDTFYGASKVAGEYICRAHAIQNNKPIVTVRPFSVYGPNEGSPEHLIPNILRSLKGGEMELDPSPKHDFIFLEDFIDGLLTVLNHAPLLKGQSINVGSGFQYSNLEVVETLEKITGKKVNYKLTGRRRNYDTSNWVGDNTLLKKLGWNPKYDLTEGLTRVWEETK